MVLRAWCGLSVGVVEDNKTIVGVVLAHCGRGLLTSHPGSRARAWTGCGLSGEVTETPTLVAAEEEEGVGVVLLLVGVEVVGVGVRCESGRVWGSRASLSSSWVRCPSSSP